MSTTSSSAAFGPPTPPPPPLPLQVTAAANVNSPINTIGFGYGYGIAIALGFLVLLSTFLLASYLCCRSAAARRRHQAQAQAQQRANDSNDNGIYLPRIIFVAEDDEESENSAQNVVVGLEPAVINSYPKFVYSKKLGNNNNDGDTMCAICLCEYRDSEMLRLLPDCKHYFHVTCVDAWLKLNASCPVCRNSPLPTPLSTPLSEVVPLSQYSDGRRRS